jgi:hypothetical protein
MDRDAALPLTVALTRAVLIGDRFALLDLVRTADPEDVTAALLQSVHLLAVSLTTAHTLDGAHEVLDGLAATVHEDQP